MKKLLLFLLFFFFFAPKAFADDSFDVSYRVVYKVNQNETTNATLNISLKNRTTDYYASSYKINLSFRDINNISARDAKGPITAEVDRKSDSTEISFEFNDKVVGINNTNNFSVSFDTNDIASRYGRIWEVNVPGVSNQNDFNAFNVRVEVPPDLGSPVFVKPTKNFVKGQNFVEFTKEELGESGVSISYGDYQVYDFNLNYHLYNKNLFPVTNDITIPSDNNYQTVLIDDIVPRPENVVKDKDGNWIASFKLLPSENKDIKVKGQAKILLNPKASPISTEDIELYTRQQKYWETKNQSIINLAKRLKTPEAIFHYVSDNLTYDESRVKDTQVRAGAQRVLANPKSAVCLEFTDLFIALSRAAGIPAREVEGFANTNNSAQRPLSLLKDVLHSWPEYYDFKSKRWIMVDPTWENTTKGIDYFNTFDYDHFAFVIKGVSSDYPVPAGGYKIPGKEDIKDISVTSDQVLRKKEPTLSVVTDFEKRNAAGLPITGSLILENTGGIASPPQTIEITSEKLEPHKSSVYVPSIPPFGKSTSVITFNSTSFLTNEEDELKIRVGRDVITKGIVVAPVFTDYRLILGGIFIVITITILSFIIRRSRRIHVPRPSWGSPLRGKSQES